MLVPVTTPGAQGGVIELQFATEQNAQLASQLLDQIYAASSENRLNIENAPTSPPRDSNLLNVFVLGDADGVMNSGPNSASVPLGYSGIINAFMSPATISGAQGQIGESVFSGQGGLTFYMNGGSGTVIAGGGSNLIAPGIDRAAAGNGWTILLDGGNNIVVASIGPFSVDDGSSGAAGSNMIFLAFGDDTVQSWGQDIVVAAPGGSAEIAVFHAGTAVYGNTGPSEIFNQGGNDTVVQGSGGETVYAQASGGLYYGGAGALTFLSSPGVSSTVVAGQGSAILYGATGANSLFFVGPGPFMLDSGTASQSVVGTGGLSSGAVLFSENGGSLTLFGNSNGNFLVAGAGNVTLNAGATSGDNILFAGFGNDSIVAGSGNTVLTGGPGSDTLIGGAGADLFEVAKGFASGGNELIGNWTGNDQLYLIGYGAAGADGLPAGSAVTVVNGSEILTLSDGTRITFWGVSSANPAQFHSS